MSYINNPVFKIDKYYIKINLLKMSIKSFEEYINRDLSIEYNEGVMTLVAGINFSIVLHREGMEKVKETARDGKTRYYVDEQGRTWEIEFDIDHIIFKGIERTRSNKKVRLPIEKFEDIVMRNNVFENYEDKEIVKIKDKNDVWFMQKIDGTHVKSANNREALEDGRGAVYHVAQFRGSAFYQDVKDWLHNKKDIDGNEY